MEISENKLLAALRAVRPVGDSREDHATEALTTSEIMVKMSWSERVARSELKKEILAGNVGTTKVERTSVLTGYRMIVPAFYYKRTVDAKITDVETADAESVQSPADAAISH